MSAKNECIHVLRFISYFFFCVFLLIKQDLYGKEEGSIELHVPSKIQRAAQRHRMPFSPSSQRSKNANMVVQVKDLRGNPKPRVSPDRTGPDRNRSGVGEHFKEYFRVGSGRGILFWVGPGRGIFLPGYETFSPGISGINLPFLPKQRKWNGYYP